MLIRLSKIAITFATVQLEVIDDAPICNFSILKINIIWSQMDNISLSSFNFRRFWITHSWIPAIQCSCVTLDNNDWTSDKIPGTGTLEALLQIYKYFTEQTEKYIMIKCVKRLRQVQMNKDYKTFFIICHVLLTGLPDKKIPLVLTSGFNPLIPPLSLLKKALHTGQYKFSKIVLIW